MEGSASGGTPSRAASGRYKCSFCGRFFASLQSLGGHQTMHREEISQMRRQHEEYMSNQRQRAEMPPPPLAPPVPSGEDPVHDGGLGMQLLPPNQAYWEAYRRCGREPQEIPFVAAVEKPNPVLVDFFGGMAAAEEKAVTAPAAADASAEEEKGKDEVASQGVDLNLKL